MVLSSIWAKWPMKRRAFFKHVSEIFSIYRLESELPENVCNFFNIGFFFFFFPEYRSLWGLQCMKWFLVYVSVEKTISKKFFFSKYFHIKRVNNSWKIFFFWNCFFNWNIQKSNYHALLDPNGTRFPGKKKKKSNIKKITNIFR